MTTTKSAKLISILVYSVGLIVFLALVGFVIFGADLIYNPDAMLPLSMREIAFVGLAAGAVPMLFASMAVYKFNNLKQSAHKKRSLFFVFLPTFLCGLCLIVVGAIVLIALIKGLLHMSTTGVW